MSHPEQAAPDGLPFLPLVVQVGFAGARKLLPEGATVDAAAFERSVADQLKAELQNLPARLGLGPQHLLVGLSQVAAGADALFTEAIAELGWAQRIFLPQLREDYLNAGSHSAPDFDKAERDRACKLLGMAHIIEESVVSIDADREARFEDTNLHILAEADVLVCLRREGQRNRPGGTAQLVERAEARGMTLLELCVSVGPEGQALMECRWNPGAEPAAFVPPVLPAPLESAAAPAQRPQAQDWPSVQSYAEALKAQASTLAEEGQSQFKGAAAIIVGTHLAATFLATLVIKIVGDTPGKILLGAEMLLLFAGVLKHRQLHKEKHTEEWAIARVCAEMARSVLAFWPQRGSLKHLLALPIPLELRPVLRTLNVLQLRQLKREPVPDWRAVLAQYQAVRLDKPDKGQISYYKRKQLSAERLAKGAGLSFMLLSVLAMCATLTKLVLKVWFDHLHAALDWTGLAAVVLPVTAVAAMSVAAALDAEARAHTFGQMHGFLIASRKRLSLVASAREAALLVAETEARLFGETVIWYSRRAFTSVA